MPQRLTGLAIAGARPVGVDLPPLDERGATAAWRAALGPGPYYVRFEERGAEPDLDQVQRLARLGEVWLDGHVDGVDGALDLLVAGAARLVLPAGEDGLIEAVGDAAAIACMAPEQAGAAAEAASRHGTPLVAIGVSPPAEAAHAYEAPPLPWRGPVRLEHVGPVPAEADAPASDDGDDVSADDAEGADLYGGGLDPDGTAPDGETSAGAEERRAG